jgi:hypothetical protein
MRAMACGSAALGAAAARKPIALHFLHDVHGRISTIPESRSVVGAL